MSVSSEPDKERLNSWKEIAFFLGRDARTVQRWEKTEGLPIHRHRHAKLDSVYAYKWELMRWQESRKSPPLSQPEIATASLTSPVLIQSPAPEGGRRSPSVLSILLVVALGAAAVSGVVWLLQPTKAHINPNMIAVPLFTSLGEKFAPSFSPDGKKVAFVWKGESQKNYSIYIKDLLTRQVVRFTSSPDIEYSSAWSRDGNWIAYCRADEKGHGGIWLAPVSGGGAQRRIADFNEMATPSFRMLSWSPDGQFLVTSAWLRPAGKAGLYLISIESGRVWQLTHPLPGVDDVTPAFSPDGKMIAFARDTGRGVSSVYLLPFHGSELSESKATRLSWPGFEHTYCGDPVWTPDSKQIIFDSNYRGDYRLWLVSTVPAAQPAPLPLGSDARSVTVSLDGQLAFTHEILNVNIWKLDVGELRNRRPASPVRVVASTRIDVSPATSPDGKKLAFASTQSGFGEIWVSNVTGMHAEPITSTEVPNTGSPSWSPDGKQIAFDSRVFSKPQILLVSSSGGKYKAITDGEHLDVMPCWSPDVKWIYFTSDRSGRREIWRTSTNGSSPEQVTKAGGFSVLLTPDGKFILYNKVEAPTSLWQMNLLAGGETLIAQPVVERAFAAASDGIFYGAPSPEGKTALRFIRYGSTSSSELYRFNKPLRAGLSLSLDGHTLFYSQDEEHRFDLQLVRDFWRR